MPSVVHLVVTKKFAGVERYVADIATELAGRGWDVAVIGGSSGQMPRVVGSGAVWMPGATPLEALRSLAKAGRRDVCHAHMTLAEATALVGRPVHRAPILSTRHFAERRGSSRVARAFSPLVRAGLSREVAASRFIAGELERPPDAVLPNGVPIPSLLWNAESRTVLVLQRLAPEKDTLTALRAWQAARLWDEGWSLRIVGDGSERSTLESWARRERLPAVTFVGWLPDVSGELARAGLLLAPAPAEPFGLGVIEAMGAGVPVVAAAAGGHLETVGQLTDASLFPPHDAEAAAVALRTLLPDETRRAVSEAGRKLVAEQFSVKRHVDQLVGEYETVRLRERTGRERAAAPLSSSVRELVVCSLERWDDVWRRNQFLTDVLLRRNPDLRVLFVEPPADPLHDLLRGRRPSSPRVRPFGYQGRLRVFRPLKVLPRRAGGVVDGLLRRQLRSAVRLAGFRRPILWINDVTYAPLAREPRWVSVYDVTDDWLAAPFSARERERLAALDRVALREADAVVVCSPALERSRGRTRPVTVVANAVDVDHFRRPQSRPPDLPDAPVAVYVGSLHESRLDVDLVVELARALPTVQVALVGPNSLDERSRTRLAAEVNVHLLGSRPYAQVPGYLQHAGVIVVPHLVNEFTESLDPIKAYECLVTSTPAVATPVAGFRELEGRVVIAPREAFPQAVEAALCGRNGRVLAGSVPSWEDRAREFQRVLESAAASRDRLGVEG